MLIEQPISLGSVTLPNRLVFPPFGSKYARDDGAASEALFAYYERLARGGAGLVILEAAEVNPAVEKPRNLRLDDDRFIEPLAPLPPRLRGLGAKAGVQLVDDLKLFGLKPRDLSRAEVGALVRRFVAAGARAARAGFDVIELHAAHGYALADFLSRRGNERDDEYGGGEEGRARAVCEILHGIRREAGGGVALGVRFNGDDFVRGGNTPAQAAELGRLFAAAGADYLSVSAGCRGDDGPSVSGERCEPPLHYPEACNIYLAAAVKQAAPGVPIIGAGRIPSIARAEAVLQGGGCDLAAVARALYCDPELWVKIREGRQAEIIPCDYCNSCLDHLRAGRCYCKKWREGVGRFFPGEVNQ